jgi:quercetin dioxygenase-like cupin family protein
MMGRAVRAVRAARAAPDGGDLMPAPPDRQRWRWRHGGTIRNGRRLERGVRGGLFALSLAVTMALAPAGPGPLGAGVRAALADGEPAPEGSVGLTQTTLLQTGTTVVGQPLRFPQQDAQLVVLLGELAPGGQTGRHLHPYPLAGYVLEGTLTVEMEGYGARTYTAGEALAEVVNTWHNGRNLTDRPVRFVVVYAAQEGTPIAIRP